MMNKTKNNFWLDVTIYIVFLITILTGFFLWLVIPHQLDIAFLGVSRSVWITAHICFGVVGLAGVVMHIVWHWGWLKALRGRPLGGLQKKLRANRVVDRTMWIAYIATNVFGAISWVLHLGLDTYIVRVPDRLHVVFGVMWTILLIVHLVLHWKWIASTTRRYIHVNFRRSNNIQEQENI
ncbi:MAG: DUF4405 domain-containing protein [Anaerolineaceae bacterium]|nr:DUF4405 domain-containing protein [Anaerolineaceae bacterium]